MRIFSKESKGNPGRLALEVFLGMFIVTILASIVAPIISGSFYGPRKSACLANIKNLSNAFSLYASASNDCLPPYFTFDGVPNGQHFMDVTMVYAKQKSIFLCPMDQDLNQPNQEGLPGKMSYVHCLSLRGVIPGFSTGNRVLRLTSIEDPSQVPLMRDPIRGYGHTDPNPKMNFQSPHGSGFSLTYLDGHARSKMNIDEFKEL